MPEKKRNQETTEKSHVEQCTHIYCTKRKCKSIKHSAWEITLRVAQFVTTEHLQLYIP